MFALVLLASSFTDQLWSGVKTVYAQTLQHPFLRGVAAGTLPKDRFQFYLVQDSLYLGGFAEALEALAAKAPREEWASTLRRHGEDAVKVERQLHDSILASYGVNKEAMERAAMAPTTLAYRNHLLLATTRGSFAEGLSAVLPCYWIYWEVGKELKKKGSKNADYQRWIDQYSSPEYETAVQQVLEMMSAEEENLSAAERLRSVDLFVLSARYEYMFWDMAWRLEQWPPTVSPPKPATSPTPAVKPPAAPAAPPPVAPGAKPALPAEAPPSTTAKPPAPKPAAAPPPGASAAKPAVTSPPPK